MKSSLCVFLALIMTGCYYIANDYFLIYSFENQKLIVARTDYTMLKIVCEKRNAIYNTVTVARTWEVLYGGRQGDSVRIYHREFSPDSWIGSRKDLTYDLAQSDTITFANTKMKVLEATSSEIKFIVLESPYYKIWPAKLETVF